MKLIVANWKMGLDRAETQLFLYNLIEDEGFVNEMVICPSVAYLEVSEPVLEETGIHLGAQNCCAQLIGAFTGETSVTTLIEYKCDYCIVGHSERRTMFGESNEMVKQKAALCAEHDIIPIICIGENEQEYENGQTKAVLTKQIQESIPQNTSNIVVAYEPIWAIGTGKSPTANELRDIFEFLSSNIPGVKLLYGGSVTLENAQEIGSIEGVGGLLIGGTSLNYEKFSKICKIKY